jgi:hypothetical protein
VRIILSFAFLYGTTALAVAAPVPSGGTVVTVATVVSVHEEPAGSALPGIHLEAKINGRMSDIYLAPAGFLDEFGMNFRTGDDVHIVGSRTKAGGTDVVLAREIAVGVSGTRTLYLRDERGPLWEAKPAPGAKKP